MQSARASLDEWLGLEKIPSVRSPPMPGTEMPQAGSPTVAPPSDPEALLREEQAAKFLDVPRRTLQDWRYHDRGPTPVKLGDRSVRYRRKDLLAFIDGRR